MVTNKCKKSTMCHTVPSLITCTIVFANSFWTRFIFIWLPRGATRRNIKLKCLYCPVFRLAGVVQPGPSARASGLTLVTSRLDSQWRVLMHSFKPMEYFVWVMAGSGWLTPHSVVRLVAGNSFLLIWIWICATAKTLFLQVEAQCAIHNHVFLSYLIRRYIRYHCNVMQSLENYLFSIISIWFLRIDWKFLGVCQD